jgi:hypothetical protein
VARTLTRRQALAGGSSAWPRRRAAPPWSRPACCPAATGWRRSLVPATWRCRRSRWRPARPASAPSRRSCAAGRSATASPGRQGRRLVRACRSACCCMPPPGTSAPLRPAAHAPPPRRGGRGRRVPPFALASADGRGSSWRPGAGDDAFGMPLEELLPLLAGLGLRTTADAVGVAGWSMGGGGALRLAAAAPERLAAVVATSPAVAAAGEEVAGAARLRGWRCGWTAARPTRSPMPPARWPRACPRAPRPTSPRAATTACSGSGRPRAAPLPGHRVRSLTGPLLVLVSGVTRAG